MIRLNVRDGDVLAVLEAAGELLVLASLLVETGGSMEGRLSAAGDSFQCIQSLFPTTKGPNKQQKRSTNDAHTLISCANRLNFAEGDWDRSVFRGALPRREGLERTVTPALAVGIAGIVVSTVAVDEDGLASAES